VASLNAPHKDSYRQAEQNQEGYTAIRNVQFLRGIKTTCTPNANHKRCA
jgi:hypothetical protein